MTPAAAASATGTSASRAARMQRWELWLGQHSEEPLLPDLAIVDAHHCGVLVDPASPRAIATAVQVLLASGDAPAMGLRGRHAVLAQYHWGVEAEKLLALYARVGVPRGAPPGQPTGQPPRPLP